MSDYQKVMSIDQPATEVFAAITAHISDWWSNDLTGAASHVGDSFTIAFGETRKTMDIVDVVPDKQVIWKCVASYLDIPGLKNPAEWVGTRIIWTLTAAGQGTTLTLLHEGFNQSFECYDACEAGWEQFLGSLQEYLATGVGKPYLKAVTAGS